ncbi:MAG: hypothetical protein ACOCXX_03875 [Planctomycetota bacterium]
MPDLIYDKVLFGVFTLGATELHFSADAPPVARVDHVPRPIGGAPTDEVQLRRFLIDRAPHRAWEVFQQAGAVTFDMSFEMGHHFKVFVLQRADSFDLTVKLMNVPHTSPRSIGLPESFIEMVSEGWGIFIVASPPREGAGTTIRSVVRSLRERTIEHVIELKSRRRFLNKYFGGKLYPAHDTLAEAVAFILQRRVSSALVTSGDDIDMLRAALFAAECGHLSLVQVRAGCTDEALSRVVELLEREDDASSLVEQLVENLHGVLAQRLVRRKGHQHRRVAAFEFLSRCSALGDVIRSRNWDRVEHIIGAGRREGMLVLDDSLLGLVMLDEILETAAMARARHPRRLARRIAEWRSGRKEET